MTLHISMDLHHDASHWIILSMYLLVLSKTTTSVVSFVQVKFASSLIIIIKIDGSPT